MNRKTYLLLLYIGFIGIMGLVLVLWITPYGAGVSPDSTTYLGGAKSLLAGKGFSTSGVPITHFPPLYPLFLSVVGLVNNNFVQSARFLNAILFGINAGLVALVVYLTAGRNYLTTTFAVLFFSSSAKILELHSWAWSEPLFIAFSLSCIILLSMYVEKPKLPFLIASSLSLGFAIITRYIGAALLPAAIVIVFIGGDNQKLGRRLHDTFIWLVIACSPLVIFYIRNLMMVGAVTDRSFAFHPVSVFSYGKSIIANGFTLIAPISLARGVMLAIFGLLAASFITLLVILFKRHLRDIHWRSMAIVVPLSCFLFSVFYLLFLFISISIFDAATPVDWRMLSPVFVLLIAGTFSIIWTISKTLKKPVVLYCFLFFIVLLFLIKIPDAIRSATTIRENGLGYTSRQWRDSESIAFVRTLGEDVRIYSNGADVLGFITEKKIPYIPRKFNPYTMILNTSYNNEIQAMCKDITENGAVLVYFNSISIFRKFLPTQDELEAACQLPVLQIFEDGTVLGKEHR